MSCDTNLSDNMVKLVQYSIVCIERDHEKILVCNQCKLVSDNMTDCDFDSWVIADYVTSIKEQGKVVPCNKRYLRVSYCVMGRWEKPERQYEKKELERLAGIEHAIRSLKEGEDQNIVPAG